MIKVTELSENEIEEIGEAFADYNYADGEKGMSFLYNGRDSVKEYICGYVRAMLAGGCLFSTSDKHEAFVAYKFSKDKLPASAGRYLLDIGYHLHRRHDIRAEQRHYSRQGRAVLRV